LPSNSIILSSLKKRGVNLSESGAKSTKDLLLLQHICWDKEPSQAGEVRVWLLERMRCADKEGNPGTGRLGKTTPTSFWMGFFGGGGMRGRELQKGFKRRILSSPGSRWMVFLEKLHVF